MQPSDYSYEEAIKTLNGLQTKPQFQQNKNNSNKLDETQTYLLRSGITLEQLNSLSVIHITGTKGKGSTSAYCESILRHHGYKTGFYSSPHLLEVRERIRLDGHPISHELFSLHFWKLYNILQKKMNNSTDMPMYFMFLTILAFQIFLAEKVDVAVIEVGIGGEYDCTNVLRNVPVIGITSLGVDHVNVLGNDIKQIAWHKAGIMKPNCKAFTVPQIECAMEVLKKRSAEKNCLLEVIDNKFIKEMLAIMDTSLEVIGINAALSVALSEAWYNISGSTDTGDFRTSPKTKLGLKSCFWPGRFQILPIKKRTYYIDGAHTAESIQLCRTWFLNKSNKTENKKVLIFNLTSERDSENLLDILHTCNFHQVLFVPNIAKHENTPDNTSFRTSTDEQLSRCYKHKSIWNELNKNEYVEFKDNAKVYQSVFDALCSLEEDVLYDILVTGSLHLVGACLSIIDPDLRGHLNN